MIKKHERDYIWKRRRRKLVETRFAESWVFEKHANTKMLWVETTNRLKRFLNEPNESSGITCTWTYDQKA